MRFEVVTLFPEFFEVLKQGLLGKAIATQRIQLETLTPRDFAIDRHRTVDDSPYGGGSGMVLMPGPFADALDALDAARQGDPTLRVLLTPQGAPFCQADARRFAELSCLTLVCGRYEGFDERIRDLVDEETSIGDFVMLGGETGALAIIEATARLLPGVLGNEESTHEESHSHGLLEYPQYTRPEVFRGQAVPDVLRSGDHGRIARWRRKEAIRRTVQRRPELLIKADLSSDDRRLLAEVEDETAPRSNPNVSGVYCALVHHPIRDRQGAEVATSVTNIDVHDIARTARTYGLNGYFIVSPIEAQHPVVRRIVEHWCEGAGKQRFPERTEAIALVEVCRSIEEAISEIEAKEGARPRVLGTSARPDLRRTLVGYDDERSRLERSETPTLILFGTGHGLAESTLDRVDALLAPIHGPTPYNHLSVRAAAAIVLDRLFSHGIDGN